MSAINLYNVVNVDESTPNTNCNGKYEGEEWRCYSIQNLYPFLQGRYLIISSEYDALNIEEFLNISCLVEGVSGFSLKGCSSDEMAYI